MLRRRLRSEEGAALVEFAIAVPVLLLIVWCMVDFSRAFYTSNSLASAVREGARYASSRQDFGSANLDSIKTRVRHAFSPAGGDTLTNSKITITVPSLATAGQVTVQVTGYEWYSTSPLTLFAVLSSGKRGISMTRRATFRWERDYSS